MNNLMVRTLLVMSLCLFGILGVNAEDVKGRIVNAETGEPLAKASIKWVINREYGSFESIEETDSAGQFCFNAPYEGRLVMTFSMIGFKINRKVNYVYGKDGKETLDFGTVKLQPTALMLSEVEVKSNVPRITMSGDTIVFNPSAFKMKDGDRLAELIRKLPGVHRDGGKLMWNGKPIRLMVNGRDMFGGDEILEQLPAEVAGKIKLYDRKSELARHTGKDDGGEDHVLDIQVKPGFLDKWYGELEASYVTEDRYIGKLQASRISEKNPQMVYFKANNANQKLEREDGSWLNADVDKFGKDIFGAYNFDHIWNTKGTEAYAQNRLGISASLGHADGWGSDNSTTDTYFPNTERIVSTSRNSNNTHSLKPKLEASLFAYTDHKNTVKVNANLTYEKQRKMSENDGTRYVFGSGDLVSRNKYYTSAESELRKLATTYEWNHFIGKKGSFTLSGATTVSGKDNYSHVSRSLEYLREGNVESLWQYGDSPEKMFYTSLSAKLEYWLGSKMFLSLSDALSYTRNHDSRDFYASTSASVDDPSPSTYDGDNSMDYTLRSLMNTVALSMMVTPVKDLSITPSLNWYFIHKNADLAAGKLDTSTVRNDNLFWPSLTMKWKINRMRNMNLSFAYYTYLPDLYITLGWRNTIDPMLVRTGNPSLRSLHSHATTYTYNRLWLRQQITLSFRAAYAKDISPLATLYHYDSATGAYQVTNVNVKGGERYKVGAAYDQGIGVFLRLKNDANALWGKSYGYNTQVDNDRTMLLNRQRLFEFTDNFEFSYTGDKLELSLFNNLVWSRYRYTDNAYNTNLFNTDFGASASLNVSPFYIYIKVWDEFRSGYKASEMNRHRVMSMAMASYRFCKNKCRLSLYVDDVFNQKRDFTTRYSAYERTENWSESLHHYLNLTFSYRFDAKAKK